MTIKKILAKLFFSLSFEYLKRLLFSSKKPKLKMKDGTCSKTPETSITTRTGGSIEASNGAIIQQSKDGILFKT